MEVYHRFFNYDVLSFFLMYQYSSTWQGAASKFYYVGSNFSVQYEKTKGCSQGNSQAEAWEEARVCENETTDSYDSFTYCWDYLPAYLYICLL